jgi:hypothetical protein
MTTEAPELAPTLQSMRRTQRIVLGWLAACTLLIVAHGFEGDEPAPDRVIATAGVLLALAAIVLRRVASSPTILARTALALRLGGLLACGALGVLGLYVAYGLDSPESGILFTLAGVIFALRPSPLDSQRRD